MTEHKKDLNLPETKLCGHFVGWLQSCGYCLFGSGGPIPLTFQEIASWSGVCKHEISGFEAEVIRKLSEVYCSVFHQARDPNFPDPHSDEESTPLAAFKNLVERYK